VRGDDRAEPVPGEHDPVVGPGQQARALGDRHEVVPERLERVLHVRILGGSVGQTVAAQIGRHNACRGTQTPGHRGPHPGGLRDPVDEQHAGSRLGPTPVEEVDAITRVEDDDEPLGLRVSVGWRHRAERELHRG
jgi:hypothetical protein